MNVLIYNGPGTSKRSVAGALSSLTALLSPYYSVRVISPSSLIGEPWQSTTALLVIPGGRDFPYCLDLNGDGTKKIDEYVRRGGRYLGLCAGAYWASKYVEFELGTSIALQGSRELSFWKGICRGCAFSGFLYDSEHGARMARISTSLPAKTTSDAPELFNALSIDKSVTTGQSDQEIYWNGGGIFVDAANDSSAKVLASYTEKVKVEGGSAAVISIAHGSGSVVLSAIHPELALVAHQPTRTRSSGQTSSPEALQGLEPSAECFIPLHEAKALRDRQRSERFDFLRTIMQELGLRFNQELAVVPQLSTLHLLCYSEKLRGAMIETLRQAAGDTKGDRNIITAEHDTFSVITGSSQRPSVIDDPDTDIVTLDEQVKYICTHRHPPEFSLFDSKKYFALLHKLHYSSQALSTTYSEPSFGTTLLYAETVTSSQSILDKNFSLQRQLPHGFTILCSHQLSGRGRGQNSWISPAGVLSFSSLLHHTPQPSEKPNSIVFIQYLISLAVVESILSLRPGLGVKIKWPNDIYLEIPSSSTSSSTNFTINGKSYAKVSGSLITTSYYQGKYILTVGVGINVSNPHPTISLNSVLSEKDAISLEELFATFMVTFSNLYVKFLASASSFRPFQDRYYQHWLHSEQLVTIESTGEQGSIQGINLEDGTLRVKTARGEIGLQADGNSFDMMKGLLKLKT